MASQSRDASQASTTRAPGGRAPQQVSQGGSGITGSKKNKKAQ